MKSDALAPVGPGRLGEDARGAEDRFSSGGACAAFVGARQRRHDGRGLLEHAGKEHLHGDGEGQ
eukprot:4715622-Pyramimonas_sp.AAC.1